MKCSCGHEFEPEVRYKHRLLCGDSRDPAAVALLMGGEKAACMWTDPPYGVNYAGGTGMTIQNDNPEGLAELLTRAFKAAEPFLIPGAPFYIAHPGRPLQLVFLTVLATIGWRVHEQLIWVKDSMVLGYSDYHYKHEPILYGWTPGGDRPGRGNSEGSHWYGDNAQVSVFEIPRPKASENHPTMKPPRLIMAQLQNSTRRLEIVFDGFLGSGSTMEAATCLDRRCFGIEIEEKYCAVILERMTVLGLTPEVIP